MTKFFNLFLIITLLFSFAAHAKYIEEDTLQIGKRGSSVTKRFKMGPLGEGLRFDPTGPSLEASSDGSIWTPVGGTATDNPFIFENLSMSGSVAANALTIALKTKANADPSGGSPVKIAFRSSTLTNGSYNVRSVTSALSVVVSSGSTLGFTSGNPHYLYVYALDNAGTVELAVSGSPLFDRASVISTTAEGGAGAADSSGVMYSTTARSNVPFVMIGRMKATEATAGTWATAPSEVSFAHQDPMLITPWVDENASFTWNNLGTISIHSFNTRRVGDTIEFNASFQTNGGAASPASLSLPSKYILDGSKMGTQTNLNFRGLCLGAAAGQTVMIETAGMQLFYDGSDATKLYLTKRSDAGNAYFGKENGDNLASTTRGFGCFGSFPIVSFGP